MKHSIFRASIVMPAVYGRERDEDWVRREFPGALEALENWASPDDPRPTGVLSVQGVYDDAHGHLLHERLWLEGDDPGDDWIWCPEVGGPDCWRRDGML